MSRYHLKGNYTIILCGQCSLSPLYSSFDLKPLIASRLPSVISRLLISCRGSCCKRLRRLWNETAPYPQATLISYSVFTINNGSAIEEDRLGQWCSLEKNAFFSGIIGWKLAALLRNKRGGFGETMEDIVWDPPAAQGLFFSVCVCELASPSRAVKFPNNKTCYGSGSKNRRRTKCLAWYKRMSQSELKVKVMRVAPGSACTGIWLTNSPLALITAYLTTHNNTFKMKSDTTPILFPKPHKTTWAGSGILDTTIVFLKGI